MKQNPKKMFGFGWMVGKYQIIQKSLETGVPLVVLAIFFVYKYNNLLLRDDR
jgi:hypothetical protein